MHLNSPFIIRCPQQHQWGLETWDLPWQSLNSTSCSTSAGVKLLHTWTLRTKDNVRGKCNIWKEKMWNVWDAGARGARVERERHCSLLLGLSCWGTTVSIVSLTLRFSQKCSVSIYTKPAYSHVVGAHSYVVRAYSYVAAAFLCYFDTGRTAVKQRRPSREQRQRWQWGDLLGGEWWTGCMGRRSSSSTTPTLCAAVSSWLTCIHKLIKLFIPSSVVWCCRGVNCRVVLEDGAVFTGVASDRVS